MSEEFPQRWNQQGSNGSLAKGREGRRKIIGSSGRTLPGCGDNQKDYLGCIAMHDVVIVTEILAAERDVDSVNRSA